MPSTKIGSDTFVVTPLGFLRTLYLQPKLAPVLAEVGAALFGVLGDKLKGPDGKPTALTIEAIMDIDLSVLPLQDLAAAVTRICLQLKRPDLEYIVRELLDGATMNGMPLLGPMPGSDPIDGFLMGRSFDGWRLIFFAVKTNYPDVFSPRAQAATGAAASPSAASTTSGT